MNMEKNMLQAVQGSLQVLTCGTASHISMLHMQVWRTVNEEDVYPYLNQRVEHLEPMYGFLLLSFAWFNINI